MGFTFSKTGSNLSGRGTLWGDSMKGVVYDVDYTTISGGLGNDTIVALGKIKNTLYGGFGSDVFEVAQSAQNATNYFYGEFGNDTVTGGNGVDYFYGAGQADLGNGNDFGYGGWISSTTIKGNGGNDQIYGGISHDLFSGGQGNDWINGYGGNDIISGDENDDNIYGGQGADLLYGASGNDFIRPSNRIETVFEGDTVFGGLGNDTIIEGSNGYSIHGGDGDDLTKIVGFGSVHGENGNDVFEIGAKEHKRLVPSGEKKTEVYGGNGADKVDVYATPNDRLYIELGYGNDTATIHSRTTKTYSTINGGYGSDVFDFKVAGYFQIFYSAALESNLKIQGRDQIKASWPFATTVGSLLDDYSFDKKAFVSHVKESNGWGNVNFVDKHGTEMQILLPNQVSWSWGLI